MLKTRILAVAAALLSAPLAWADAVQTQLVMVEQAGCHWCERWHEEIAPIYPKTAEGRFAPLSRVDIDAATPGLTFARGVNFTPTFILVQHGRELSRLEGYPGEDFFWPLLTRMLTNETDFDITEGAAAPETN